MKLLLINKDNPLPRNYKPALSEVCDGYFMDIVAAASMKKMICTALSNGIHLRVFSAYRSISYQKGLFNEDVDRYMLRGMSFEDAYAKTSLSIAKPGESEHNAGLAVDITSAQWQGEINESFENTPEFKWLNNNAHYFGFILRYPKNKTDITGITYEPWHYRYVGSAHAQCIKRMGITLEEYLQKQGLQCAVCEEIV